MGLMIGRRPLRHVVMLGGTGFAAGVAKARAQRRRAQHADVDRLVASLRELQALRDEGVLSPEEFEAAKRRVLAE
jgi:hypothetical protein